MNDVNYKDPATFKEQLVYMFSDPKWITKILIGALVGCVPILNFVLGGYALRVINNTRTDEQPTLPEWSPGFGKLWKDGLLVAVIGILYGIPAWILSAIIAGAAAASNSEGAVIAVSVLLGLILLAYGIALFFWIQGALVNYAVKGNFGAGFAFGEIWEIVRNNIGRLALTVVLAVVVGIIVGVISAILGIIPCIGWILVWILSFASSFYVLLVLAHNCGLVAKSLPAPIEAS
jgi:hypothetical protein